jgi:hypothetical protein
MNAIAAQFAPEALRRVDDFECFARCPLKVQKAVIMRINWIIEIEQAARGERGQVIERAADALGVSVPTVNRFVRAFANRGWKGLIDQRGKNVRTLPPEFKAFIRALHLQCQRATTGREVHRMLIERWTLWKTSGDARHAIPGYDEPPAAESTGYPLGWSEDNILRMRPDGYALTVARQGAKKAAAYLPSILKTRVGSRFGAVIFMDDQMHDIKVAPRGLGQRAIRPLEFSALDYLSGCFLQNSIQFRWWDVAADQYRSQTNESFVWHVITYLQRHGYRADSTGTCMVFEHGSACGYSNKNLITSAGFSDFDDALAAVSYGCIRIHRSGLFNSPAFAGMLFKPQSSGNPNSKAPLESVFNLVRNRMSALPGPTGLKRDMKPLEEFGRDTYTAQLLKLWDRLDERHRELIRFPVLTAEQFGEVAARVYDAINNRTDHALQGWEECGFLAPQMRFTPDERSPWLSQAEVANLPEASRVALLSNMEKPGHVRTARLSPAEVARQCAGELTKLPDHAVPLLIPTGWARPVTVKDNRTISISDQLMGPEAFQYVARFEDADGARVLKPGTNLLAYLNPFAPSRLVVCREDGAFLGTLHQMTRAGFSDEEAIIDQLKARAAMKSDMDTAIRPHLEGVMRDRADMKRTNERLAQGKPVLPDEIAAARSESAREGVRTRKIHEIAAAMGADALNPSNLLNQDDAEDVQEACMPTAQPFSAAQFLNQPTEDDD